MEIATLENDIKELGAKLDRTRGYLESATDEEQNVLESTSAISEKLALTDSARLLENEAESMERKYRIAKGLRRWEPSSLTENELKFCFVGPCPKACIQITFPLSDQNGVPCRALIEPALFRQHRARHSAKLTTKVMSFLERQVADVCHSINQTRLDSPKSIGVFLQKLELQLVRTERTASELAALARRYQAVLQLSDDSSTVQLEIEFADRSGFPKLRAVFDIGDNYPLAPLHTCLDSFGEMVDVEHARKLLIKNAKPGYGYLSRACALIEAFVK